jgi:hypothetical protein
MCGEVRIVPPSVGTVKIFAGEVTGRFRLASARKQVVDGAPVELRSLGATPGLSSEEPTEVEIFVPDAVPGNPGVIRQRGSVRGAPAGRHGGQQGSNDFSSETLLELPSANSLIEPTRAEAMAAKYPMAVAGKDRVLLGTLLVRLSYRLVPVVKRCAWPFGARWA